LSRNDWFVLAGLAIPYVYVLATVASQAYFTAKMNFHHKLFKHMEKGEL
jgi:hypothetical protein